MPAKNERIAPQEDARSVQTLYMTGSMQITKKRGEPRFSRLLILQALD
jgi:hypothetical protein